MTESSWPFDTADTTEAQYSSLLRLIADSGVIGTPSTTDLKPYADSTGMFVKVPAGSSVIRGFFYLNDSVVTLNVAAAGSQARIDSVVLRLDPVGNSIRVFVKTGAPGSTSGPALVQTDTGIYEIRLCDIAVAASATTIAGTSITDRRVYSSQEWGVWSTATRPSGIREGKAGYNFSTKSPEFWDGSNWQPFALTTTNAAALTSGTLANARLDYGVVAGVRGDRPIDAPMAGDLVNGDWNLVLQPGAYRVFAGNTNTNAPDAFYNYGTLVVFGAGANMASRTQAYFEHGGNGYVYTRTAWNGNDWNTWRRVVNSVETDALRFRVGTEEQTRAQGITNVYSDYDNGRLDTRYLRRGQNGISKSGAQTMQTFTQDSATGRWIGVETVAVSGMSVINSVIVCANSGDSGAVTGQYKDVTATGFTAVITRRNNFSTGYSWVAFGTAA